MTCCRASRVRASSAAQRRLYERMDAVVVHSAHGRRRLVDELGLAGERVHVIPHGVLRPWEGSRRRRAVRRPRGRRASVAPCRRSSARPGARSCCSSVCCDRTRGLDVAAGSVAGDGRGAAADRGWQRAAELWIVGMPRMELGFPASGRAGSRTSGRGPGAIPAEVRLRCARRAPSCAARAWWRFRTARSTSRACSSRRSAREAAAAERCGWFSRRWRRRARRGRSRLGMRTRWPPRWQSCSATSAALGGDGDARRRLPPRVATRGRRSRGRIWSSTSACSHEAGRSRREHAFRDRAGADPVARCRADPVGGGSRAAPIDLDNYLPRWL